MAIAGGGVGALECALALAELARDRTEVTVIAPDPEFVCRPMTVREPFSYGPAARYPLAQIIHVRDSLFVQADDDIPVAKPGLSGWTAAGWIEEKRAIGVSTSERSSQRQLKSFHFDAEPPLLRVVRLTAQLHRQLDEPPLRLRWLT